MRSATDRRQEWRIHPVYLQHLKMALEELKLIEEQIDELHKMAS
jgi:hypothetical protein